jgi:hypothetical protein
MISFTPRPLYSRGNSPPVPIGYGAELGSRDDLDAVEKIFIPAGNRKSINKHFLVKDLTSGERVSGRSQ